MSRLRIGICKIKYETNSFSTVETSLDYFKAKGRILIGSQLCEQDENRCEISGFLNTIKASGRDIEVVPLLSVNQDSGGYITEESVSYLDELLNRMLKQAGRLDGILFALHGAMASAKVPDLESHFLDIVRQEEGESIPVVCTLDLHAVITQKMIDLGTLFTAYRTTPHVDIIETGERAANILLQILSAKIEPVMAIKKIPLIIPPNKSGTNSGPLKELYDRLKDFSRLDGMIDCSFCCSQCWLDVEEQGWTALAVTDDDYSLAQKVANELAIQAWNNRKMFLPEAVISPEDAIRSAILVEGFPVVILDSADIHGGGAPGDGTGLLKILLEKRETIDGLILVDLPDPQAIQQIVAAGEGATVKLRVGGKLDTRFSRPIPVTGKVLCITEGAIESVWKDRGTSHIDAGKIACIGIDNLRLVLTEKTIQYAQPLLYHKVDLEPLEAKIVAVKTSSIGCAIAYKEAPKAVFKVDCGGATSFNLSNFEYKYLDRPIYPLDPDMDYGFG